MDIKIPETEWSTARQCIKKQNTDIYDIHIEKEQICITPDKPYRNKFCTIRKGILLTAPKAQ